MRPIGRVALGYRRRGGRACRSAQSSHTDSTPQLAVAIARQPASQRKQQQSASAASPSLSGSKVPVVLIARSAAGASEQYGPRHLSVRVTVRGSRIEEPLPWPACRPPNSTHSNSPRRSSRCCARRRCRRRARGSTASRRQLHQPGIRALSPVRARQAARCMTAGASQRPTIGHAETVMGTVVPLSCDPGGLSDAAVHSALAQPCRTLHEADGHLQHMEAAEPISRLRRGEATVEDLPAEVATVLGLCERRRRRRRAGLIRGRCRGELTRLASSRAGRPNGRSPSSCRPGCPPRWSTRAATGGARQVALQERWRIGIVYLWVV